MLQQIDRQTDRQTDRHAGRRQAKALTHLCLMEFPTFINSVLRVVGGIFHFYSLKELL